MWWPFLKPGDPKILRSQGDDVRHPRLLQLIYVLLSLAAIAAGLYWLVIGGQIASGAVLILGGAAVLGAILYHEISEELMVRRMRKRK